MSSRIKGGRSCAENQEFLANKFQVAGTHGVLKGDGDDEGGYDTINLNWYDLVVGVEGGVDVVPRPTTGINEAVLSWRNNAPSWTPLAKYHQLQLLLWGD